VTKNGQFPGKLAKKSPKLLPRMDFVGGKDVAELR
jgi:hypothetical protein